MTESADAVEPAETDDALVAALIEIEHHVAQRGWDQPARLFALVPTAELIRQEPSLAAHLRAGSPDSLSSIEQEDFVAGDDLGETLARMQWPPSVVGCAVVIERTMLPKAYEADLPRDRGEAIAFVQRHPAKVDTRIVAGALRDGNQHGIGRHRSHPDDLVGSPQFAPQLQQALSETLTDLADHPSGDLT